MCGNERWMRPCRATRAGTQAPPLPISVIFYHAIPHKQNNHLRTIHPNEITHSTHNLPKRHQPSAHVICPNDINHPHAIHPNETVGAVPVCPPERPRSGVSIPRTHALCAGILTMDAPLWGDTGGHTGTAPTHLHQTMRGVPLPRSGYTFDSAGLASATQPTLGNNASEEATHNVGYTFFRLKLTMLPHTQYPPHTIGGGNASRTSAPSTLNEWNFMILASP